MNTKSQSQKLHLSIGLISLVAIVIFTLQNAEVVTVSFLFWKLEMSRVILLLIVLIIGFLLGYLVRGAQNRGTQK